MFFLGASRLCIICLLGFVTLAAAETRAWFVDCAEGNDSADGLSTVTAWRTTQKASAHVFAPGDSLQIRRGTVCAGKLWPQGSGSATAQIHLTAWGTGALPKIQAEAGAEAAFRLFDQEYWTVDDLEFSGGNPHGIYVSGSKGVLHGIHIADVVVHDVTGLPKNKEGGLLVVSPGGAQQRFEDVVIDGATAFGTSQWSGILVGGVTHGTVAHEARSAHVIIRNSIAHDMAGDGIVLFQVNNGSIENSIAWHTGMQETQTIGTPDAIWTWMCRDCVVRGNEAFLTDSPGIDGGAFDIDYGNDNNTFERNYGHDTQGYCVSVFGAGQTTTNSIVRDNVCVENGRSPRLAQLQGAVFLSTWNNGKLKGVTVEGNHIFWTPPIAAAAVVNKTDIDSGAATFENNTIISDSPLFVISNSALMFDHNHYSYTGTAVPRWEYGGKDYAGIEEFRSRTAQDMHSDFATATRRQPPPSAVRWTLRAYVSGDPADHDSRGIIALVESVHRQYPNVAVQVLARRYSPDLRYDWNAQDLQIQPDRDTSRHPGIVLEDSQGKIAWHCDGLPAPGDLGLALRHNVGEPEYAQLGSKP